MGRLVCLGVLLICCAFVELDCFTLVVLDLVDFAWCCFCEFVTFVLEGCLFLWMMTCFKIVFIKCINLQGFNSRGITHALFVNTIICVDGIDSYVLA